MTLTPLPTRTEYVVQVQAVLSPNPPFWIDVGCYKGLGDVPKEYVILVGKSPDRSRIIQRVIAESVVED